MDHWVKGRVIYKIYKLRTYGGSPYSLVVGSLYGLANCLHWVIGSIFCVVYFFKIVLFISYLKFLSNEIWLRSDCLIIQHQCSFGNAIVKNSVPLNFIRNFFSNVNSYMFYTNPPIRKTKFICFSSLYIKYFIISFLDETMKFFMICFSLATCLYGSNI